MEIKTNAGKTYTVVSASGCTVITLDGTQIKEIAAGQDYFTAISGVTVITDDSAVVQEVFKLAPYQKLTLLGVVGGTKLPSGYTCCEYLESTGTQYIALPFAPLSEANKVLDVGIRCETQVLATINWRPPMGVSRSDGNLGLFPYGNSGSNRIYFMHGTKRYDYSDASLRNLRAKSSLNWLNSGTYHVETEKRTFEGELSKTESTLTASFNFHLFLNANGGFTQLCASRIWSAAISHYEKVLFDLIPAIDNTGTPCMYNTVTRQPFYNQGTGAFVVGLTAAQARKLGNLPAGGGTLTISLPSDVVDENGVLQDMAIFTALSAAAAKGWSFILQTHDGTAVETAVPAGYMECEFLESTGTQYINTELSVDNESDVECRFRSMTTEDTYVAHEAIFGTREDFFPGITLFAPADAYNKSRLIMGSGSLYTFDPSEVHTAKINKNEFAFDNIVYPNTVGLTREYNFMMLFCANLEPDAIRTGFWAKAQVYSFTISNSGTPQANYTPAITPAGVPCMYDSVTAQPFTNAGTGDFVVGMTAAQAVQLANLPTGGGTLTVSLPQSILNDAGEIMDAAVRAALNKAGDNGWDLTLQYYTEQ